MAKKKVHFWHGCQYATGELQMADTTQVLLWCMVTCRMCLANAQPNGHSRHWSPHERDKFLALTTPRTRKRGKN